MSINISTLTVERSHLLFTFHSMYTFKVVSTSSNALFSILLSLFVQENFNASTLHEAPLDSLAQTSFFFMNCFPPWPVLQSIGRNCCGVVSRRSSFRPEYFQDGVMVHFLSQLYRPEGAQMNYFWMCLHGCFQKRVAFGLVGLVR